MARILEAGFDELERQYTRRMSELGQLLVERARANAPVRRGYRSFDKSAGPVGGTLRDSITYAVAFEGSIIESPTDGNGAGAPGWLSSELKGGKDQLELLVYTNTGQVINKVSGTMHDYGLFVHEGTTAMPARPFLTEAVEETDLAGELER